jgi:fatty-acyl-CoA synthase
VPHMMDDFPLLLSTLYERAVRIYPDQEIVSVESDRSIVRQTYAETDDRVRRLATAFQRRLGSNPARRSAPSPGTTGATTSSTGRPPTRADLSHRQHPAVPDQITYIVNHAGDRADVRRPRPGAPPRADRRHVRDVRGVRGDGRLGGRHDRLPGPSPTRTCSPRPSRTDAWPLLDERSPMMFCYTSGTTGNPKGVAYTQRSTYLHTISNLANFHRPRDNVMPVVPMFHASAWGYPFMATTRGRSSPTRGPTSHAQGLVPLFVDEERVTFSAGVPTVWLGISTTSRSIPRRRLLDPGLPVRRIGGSEGDDRVVLGDRGIRVVQGWGMTETNPVASVALLKPHMEEWDLRAPARRAGDGGAPDPGLQVKIVDEDGEPSSPRRRGVRRVAHPGAVDRRRVLRGPPESPSRSRTAGCAPATSARSLPRATSASPTGPRT